MMIPVTSCSLCHIPAVFILLSATGCDNSHTMWTMTNRDYEHGFCHVSGAVLGSDTAYLHSTNRKSAETRKIVNLIKTHR